MWISPYLARTASACSRGLPTPHTFTNPPQARGRDRSPQGLPWWRSWLVFKTAMLLLAAVPPEPRDLYGEHFRALSEVYGPQAWFRIYQADVQMRSEEFERLLRKTHLADAASRAAEGPGVPGFDVNKPWGYIFQQSIHSENSYTTAFWAAQAKDKAWLHQCRLRGNSELTSDGTVASFTRSTVPASTPLS